MSTTYPSSEAVLERIPLNTTIKVTNRRGAFSTSARIAVDSNPECSATETPSKATSTVPSGAKPVKLVTMCVMIQCRPSTLINETTSMVPDAVCASSGRGSATDTPSQLKKPLNNTMNTVNMANSVTGWGNRFPNHSTVAKNRENQPLLFSVVVILFSVKTIPQSFLLLL